MSRYLLRRLGLVLCGLLLGAGLTLPVAGPAPAGDSKPKPLTDAQKEKLKERDRLMAEADKLGNAGKFTEMVAVVEKLLAIEREIFGEVHEEVAVSLDWLGRIHESRKDF